MKKFVIWINVLIALSVISGQVLAQGQGGGGFFGAHRGAREGRAEGRGEAREAAQARFRQRQLDRAAQPAGERAAALDAVPDGARINRDPRDSRIDRTDGVPEAERRGRLTIEERRALRRQIRDARNDIYNRQR